ncbi:hypothetical protein E4H04_04110 [Candidatus Bathyarchaeota archaeon]|nr:MAG: hypothetical protein E4H04_04110 [Candidatus Bathyarchaeota archaeon]
MCGMKLKLITVLIIGVFWSSGVGLVHASDGPSARMGHSMAYDPQGDCVLLFGGCIWQDNRYTFYNDLWSYSDGAWSEIEVSGVKPSGRFNIPMVYIPDRHQLFVFGGFSSSDRIGDTWIYDIAANEWIKLQPDTGPPRRSDAAIAYDGVNKVVVMFGGYGAHDDTLDDTWVFDFSEMNWIEKNPTNKPLIQYGGHMVYDSLNSELIMYPGHWSIKSNGALISHGYGDEVWRYSYEENSWTELETSPKPRGRYWFNLAYDTDNGKMILFGGSNGGSSQLSDTWLYDYEENSWSEITTQPRPPVRANSAMAYSSSSNSVVLFGGSHLNQATYDDTWILDVETGIWSEIVVENESQTEEQQSIPGFTFSAVCIGIVFTLWIKRSYKLRV